MLKQLLIENIAVIEKADIEFMDGFIVLSGETGAGKSIIIDALNAVLGSRVSREIIRTGQSKATVSALFADISTTVAKASSELGFECEDGSLLVRRDVYADGKNSCKINGGPATLTMLKELSAELVNIHGQHDGQHLLNELLHIDYLDIFASSEGLLLEYNEQYDRLLHLNRRIKSLSMSSAEKGRRIAQLNVFVQELELLNPKQGEEQELNMRRQELINSERIISGLSGALACFDGSEDVPGISGLLSRSVDSLRSCEKYSAGAAGSIIRANELEILVADLHSELNILLSAINLYPGELEDIETRLDAYDRLCKKHHATADELLITLEGFKQELDSLDEIEEDMDKLKEDYANMRSAVFELCNKLHEHRQVSADRLRTRVETELKQLDMPNARFCAEIESTIHGQQAKFTRKGTDTVRFLMSANSGEELRPIARVASGGELSRIMLAIKNVLSETDACSTLVFDEVDAGVSGRAASKVGEKLYSVARTKQVLCVTHLPQIAALADYQYKISKSTRDGRTFTSVDLLDNTGRAEELARLTSGANITETALRSAAEMLELSKKLKLTLDK